MHQYHPQPSTTLGSKDWRHGFHSHSCSFPQVHKSFRPRDNRQRKAAPVPEGMSGREPRKKPDRGETFPPLRGSRSEAKLKNMEKQERQFAKS